MKRLFLAAMAVLMMGSVAHAEWYVAGDVLQARYQGPQVDGNCTSVALDRMM